MWQNLSLNTRVIWLLITLLAVIDAVGLKAEGIWLAPHVIMLPKILFITVLVVLSAIGAGFRRGVSMAEAMHMTAAILAFSFTTSILGYLSVGWQRPLVDSYLAAADHALGLDWIAYYKWVISYPLIHQTLYVAYYTLIVQVTLLPFVLNFMGRTGRGWEMLWLFMVSCIAGILFAGIWPAVGAFGYYHVETGNPYVHVFMALHDGSLKIIGNNPLQGVIQFPSFHVALAIIFVYAARGMRFLFPLLLVTNALLFIATPVIGGHHFADLWAGVVLALVTILVVRKTPLSRNFAPVGVS